MATRARSAAAIHHERTIPMDGLEPIVGQVDPRERMRDRHRRVIPAHLKAVRCTGIPHLPREARLARGRYNPHLPEPGQAMFTTVELAGPFAIACFVFDGGMR